MKDLLLVVLLAVIAIQGFVIAALVLKVNVLKEKAKASRKISRACISALSKALINEKKETERYKDGYNECYSAYKALFVEIKQKNHRIEELKHINNVLENAYDKICSNLTELIKSGRVIEYKYKNNDFKLLDFNSLTKNQISELFAVE